MLSGGGGGGGGDGFAIAIVRRVSCGASCQPLEAGSKPWLSGQGFESEAACLRLGSPLQAGLVVAASSGHRGGCELGLGDV